MGQFRKPPTPQTGTGLPAGLVSLSRTGETVSAPVFSVTASGIPVTATVFTVTADRKKRAAPSCKQCAKPPFPELLPRKSCGFSAHARSFAHFASPRQAALGQAPAKILRLFARFPLVCTRHSGKLPRKSCGFSRAFRSFALSLHTRHLSKRTDNENRR